MKQMLTPFASQAYALLRVVAGLMFMFHGIQKLFGFLAEQQPTVGSQVWVGGIIELVAGGMIAFGLCASIAAFIASGMMAVAYVQFHWKFQFDGAFFPAINHGEVALLYCVLFFYIACAGSGRCSVDSLCCRNHAKT